jgi:outer membrane lipoprotein-sorting protein
LLGLWALNTVLRTELPTLKRIITSIQILFLLFLTSQCSWFRVKTTTRIPANQRALPAKAAGLPELIQLLNSRAQDIRTLNLSVLFKLTGGSINTGEIANYEKTKGFILLKKPSLIRTIVLTFNVRIVDMVSNGVDFQIDVPSKNKFIHGFNNQQFAREKDSSVQLRPQHIFQAFVLDPVEPSSEKNPIDLEEDQEGIRKYYILSVHSRSSDVQWILNRRVWFDRFDLSIVRQKLFGDRGQVTSDITYREFKNFDAVSFPTEINLKRPQEDYSLTIQVTKAKINEELQNEKFILEKPPTAELVDLTQEGKTP